MLGRHILQCVRWSIENHRASSFERTVKLKRNSQSWQQCYRLGNDMGAYEPIQAAKYSIFCQSVFEKNIYKQYTDLFAVCHNLGQILRTEIFVRGPLRAREIVNQDLQGAKLIVIESTMIAVYPV